MKRSFDHDHEEEEDESRRAGPSGTLSSDFTSLSLAPTTSYPSSSNLNPTAPSFLPQQAPPRSASRHVSLSLPELPEGDEWVMVDKVFGRELLGWTEVYYCDMQSFNGDGSRYVVGVSAFEIIVGTLDLDAFPGHDNSLIGVLEWVYRKFRRAGPIIDMFIPQSKKRSSRVFVKLVFEDKDSTSRALALTDLAYVKEEMEITATVTRCFHRHTGWTICARSRLHLLESTKRRQLVPMWLNRLLAAVPDLSNIVTDLNLPKARAPRCRGYASMDALDQSTSFHTLRDGYLMDLAPTKAQREVVHPRGCRTVLPEPTQQFDDRLYGRDFFDNDSLTTRDRLIGTHSKILQHTKQVEYLQSSVDKQLGVRLHGPSLQFYKESGAGWAATATLSRLQDYSRLVVGIALVNLEEIDLQSLIDEKGHQLHEKIDSGLRSGLNEQEQGVLWKADHPDESSFPCLRIGYIHEDRDEEPADPWSAKYPFQFNSELDDPFAAILRDSPPEDQPTVAPNVDISLPVEPPTEAHEPILPGLYNGREIYQ